MLHVVIAKKFGSNLLVGLFIIVGYNFING